MPEASSSFLWASRAISNALLISARGVSEYPAGSYVDIELTVNPEEIPWEWKVTQVVNINGKLVDFDGIREAPTVIKNDIDDKNFLDFNANEIKEELK